MIGYFRFQIWIQHGQIYKITQFSSRGKTKSLNLFFSVINNMDCEKVIANKSPTHLTTWKFFYGVHSTTQREDIFSQINPKYILTPVFMVNFNLILWRRPTSFKLSPPSTFFQHFSSFMRTTSLAHLIVIYFMLLKVLSEACKLWSFTFYSFTLYSFSQPVIYSRPLCLNTLLCKLFSNIINASYYPKGNNTKMQIHTKNSKL